MVACGGSRGSSGVGWLHGGGAEALAGSPSLGREQSCGNDLEGIAGELGFGTAARGLPGWAAASIGSWRKWEWLRVLQEAAGGCFYRRSARKARAPPEDTCPRCPATNGARERGRRRRRSHKNCARARTSIGVRGEATSTVHRALCRWPDRAHARCGKLRRRRAAVGSYGGGDEDGGEEWHALAGWAASTRSTERLAACKACVWHTSTLG